MKKLFVLLVVFTTGCLDVDSMNNRYASDKCPEFYSPIPKKFSCPTGRECLTHNGVLCVKTDLSSDNIVIQCPDDRYPVADQAACGADCLVLDGVFCARIIRDTEGGGGKNCDAGYVTLHKSPSACSETGKKCVKGRLFGQCINVPPEKQDDLITVLQGQRCTKEQLNIPPDSLVVHMIDVGQGDAIWIQSPDKKNILIDAGDAGAFKKTMGGKYVAGYLAQWGFKEGSGVFDTVIVTHSHSDHYGGMPYLFSTDRYKMRYYIDPGPSDGGTAYRNWIKKAKEKAEEFYSPLEDTYKAGDYLDSKFFGEKVKARYLYSNKKAAKVNNQSVVIRLEYAGKSIMLTGDLEKEGEAVVINKFTPDETKTNYYKVCHHGSSTSSTDGFLKAMFDKIEINDRYAFVSSGRIEFSGTSLPTKESFGRLKKYVNLNQIFSTNVGDGNKKEHEASGDDNILLVIQSDGKAYMCYSGNN